MIPRLLENQVYSMLTSLHKVIIVLGARQVGKTTFLMAVQARLIQEGKSVRYLNCDLEEERQAANTTSRTRLDLLVSGMDAILIDEVQRLDDPGLTLKILADLYPHLMILVTGSSSFELRNRVNETLTGRYVDFLLYPLSIVEILQAAGAWDDLALRKPAADAILENLLLYGCYPQIYLEANPRIKQMLLSRLVESYLFRDILAYQKIRFSQTIVDLARALAYQVGNQVNESELANRLKIDRKTVVNYLDILEKSYVIRRVHPFSRNPRREIGKQSKVYFLDPGIRNALINDFNDLAIRPDRGVLWENFLIVERIKSQLNLGETARYGFWRTYGGAEIDYIEETGAAEVKAYEIKYGNRALSRSAGAFQDAYDVPVTLINQENYLEFITGLL